MPLWDGIKMHILSAEGFWCYMLMFCSSLPFFPVIHIDMPINHACAQTRAVILYGVLQIRGNKLNWGFDLFLKIRSAVLLWSVGKCILWNLLQFLRKKKKRRRRKKILFKDLLMQQTGFHLRSSIRVAKDLPVSKRTNESFLSEGGTYAYMITSRAEMALSYTLGTEALGV